MGLQLWRAADRSMGLTRKGVFKAAGIGIFAIMIMQSHTPTHAASFTRMAALGLLLLSRL
jgi:hypothetical protein